MRPDLPVTINDAELAEVLSDGMTRVEDRLLAAVSSDNDLLAASSRHLIVAGGRRLRPFLAMTTTTSWMVR